MTRGDYFIISSPVNITDSLRMVGNLLKQFPRINIISFDYSEYVNGMVFFGGNRTVISFGREPHSADMILLEEQGI